MYSVQRSISLHCHHLYSCNCHQSALHFSDYQWLRGLWQEENPLNSHTAVSVEKDWKAFWGTEGCCTLLRDCGNRWTSWDCIFGASLFCCSVALSLHCFPLRHQFLTGLANRKETEVVRLADMMVPWSYQARWCKVGSLNFAPELY